MKIGRFDFNREMPGIVLEKRFLKFFVERIRRKWEFRKGGEIGIGVTNCCDLTCFSCVSLCDTPLGSNTFRKEKYFLKAETLDLFLQRIEGFRIERWLTYTGGEATTMRISDLENLASIGRKYNRKTALVTNSFRLDKLNPFVFDYIRIDSHGESNKENIRRGVAHLRDVGYKNYEIVETLNHLDFHEAIKERFVTDGLKCSIWMGVSLWGETVYPCCCLAQMDGFYNFNKIRDSLNEAGWNVNNPTLKETIENWKETVPADVVKMCSLYCWRGRKEYLEHPVSYRRKG